jgi:hypothetical protein
MVGNTPAAPTSPVSGYNLWLDASNAGSFTFSSGSSVSQWTDRSGNAYAFTQATSSSQPTRNGTQNSLSTVYFDSNDKLTSTAASSVWKYLHDGTKSTVFIVCQSTNTAGSYSTVMSTQDLATSNVGFAFFVYNRTEPIASTVKGTNGQEISAGGTVSIDSWNVHSMYLDQGNATVYEKTKVYINSGFANVNSGNFSPSTSNPSYNLTIGGTSGASYAYKGYIAEIITYPSLLSDTDRKLNVSYLRAKWGI